MTTDFQVDFSEVQDSMEPLPEGTYLLSVVEAQTGMSNSDHPKIDVQWVVEDGEHEGRRIFDTLSFHPKALWRTKRALKQLGLPGDFAGSGEDIADFLEGQAASATVSIERSDQVDPLTNEPYPPRNRIQKFGPADVDLEDIFD